MTTFFITKRARNGLSEQTVYPIKWDLVTSERMVLGGR